MPSRRNFPIVPCARGSWTAPCKRPWLLLQGKLTLPPVLILFLFFRHRKEIHLTMKAGIPLVCHFLSLGSLDPKHFFFVFYKKCKFDNNSSWRPLGEMVWDGGVGAPKYPQTEFLFFRHRKEIHLTMKAGIPLVCHFLSLGSLDPKQWVFFLQKMQTWQQF